nr:metallophosphoesterase family protein [Desulfobulbus alkaliphilus]
MAIVADIHGNFRALQAVLADIAVMKVELILSLGDNIGYGPEPEEVVQALRHHQVVSVMGNHELGLISRSYYRRLHGTARESLALTRSLLSAESLAWLEDLPTVHIRDDARFVHGCPPESMTVYLFSPTENRLQRVFASYPERFCFVGHTHVFGLYAEQGGRVDRRKLTVGKLRLDQESRYLVLPGSVGQPRDNVNRYAKYLLWDRVENRIEIRSLAYDVQATVRLLAERHFPAVNARRLL